MSLVWERAPYSAGTLMVLLALGDWSDDEGLCWPSVQSLAHKARIKRRSTQYIIRKLAKDKIIKIEERRGRGHQNKYRINVQKLRLLPERKSAIGDTENVHFETQKAQTATEKVQRVAHDPLVDPSVEPSSDPLRASRETKTANDYIEGFKTAMRVAPNYPLLNEINLIPRGEIFDIVRKWYRENYEQAA